MNETALSVRYSRGIKTLIYTGLVTFEFFAVFTFRRMSIPFLLVMGIFMWYMESFQLDFEPETGNLCYHVLFLKPYEFHVTEITKLTLHTSRTKNGKKLFLSIYAPSKKIIILLGEPSATGHFETWDSYTNASELFLFLEKYHKMEVV